MKRIQQIINKVKAETWKQNILLFLQISYKQSVQPENKMKRDQKNTSPQPGCPHNRVKFNGKSFFKDMFIISAKKIKILKLVLLKEVPLYLTV